MHRYLKHTTRIDIRGQRFGRLRVLRDSGKRTPTGQVKWLCQCDCGKKKAIWSNSLRTGAARSCGCLAGENWRTHGLSGHKMYSRWASMNERCRNTNALNYPLYGGRGITVCARWKGPNGFPNFLQDMGICPRGKSLDRIDGNFSRSRSDLEAKRPLPIRMCAAIVCALHRRYFRLAALASLELASAAFFTCLRICRRLISATDSARDCFRGQPGSR